ncbi:MAG TPA: hypothetical protein VNK91_12000 [Burkholderiaceae bacterium]|nr:hypothetical protein [Burkholderiaceae bacterium]
MPIPKLTTSGALPPFVGDTPTDEAQMAPYAVAFSELANRFGTTPQRWSLLNGLARYRAALRKAGIIAGFQWIDGSFLEDAEALRGRPPADIDLVTFAILPPAMTPRAFVAAYSALLDHHAAKAAYGCDAYFVDLGLGARRPELLVAQTRYWFGLFSHQRASGLWKGMLQVDLYSDDEQVIGQPTAEGDSNAAQT